VLRFDAVSGPQPVAAKTRPTFYFIGVTTGRSSIVDLFPRWMEALGRPEVVLEGVDLPLHAHPEAYRQVVAHIKRDPNSLGGLVTTHKLDLYRAAADLFDCFDPYAALLGELSCISKRDGHLEGHAKDPISAGLSLGALLGEGYFARTGAQVLFFGAGGAAAATLLHLVTGLLPADRPGLIHLVDIRLDRLSHIRALVQKIGCESLVETHLQADPRQNDGLLAALPSHSLVVNATGMGKDIPGSPITDQGVFPLHGVAWEFNYRGELDFLRQAQRQAQDRRLTVEDGWLYFLHGWTQVIAQVLNVDLDATLFEKLKCIADSARQQ
jgi:shikimate 5-dehydrogenase